MNNAPPYVMDPQKPTSEHKPANYLKDFHFLVAQWRKFRDHHKNVQLIRYCTDVEVEKLWPVLPIAFTERQTIKNGQTRQQNH